MRRDPRPSLRPLARPTAPDLLARAVPVLVPPMTGRPRLLDLFCGAGGAGMGYQQAGFDVTGVDLVDRGYPLPFVQADALDYLAEHGDEFDAVHASPPCHDHTPLSFLAGQDGSGELLTHTLTALRKLGRPWIVENVEGARALMPGALTLCGSEFGLRTEHGWLRRHRLFLSSEFLMGAGGCAHPRQDQVLGLYGNSDGPDLPKEGRRGWSVPTEVGVRLMGMPWVRDRQGLTLAIPPAYTRFLGEQLLDALPKCSSS